MSKEPYPSETAERFIVRFPDGMRDRIKEAAAANNRSMNAEIISRLEASFGMDIPLVHGMVGTVRGLQAAAHQITTALENPQFRAAIERLSKQTDQRPEDDE